MARLKFEDRSGDEVVFSGESQAGMERRTQTAAGATETGAPSIVDNAETGEAKIVSSTEVSGVEAPVDTQNESFAKQHSSLWEKFSGKTKQFLSETFEKIKNSDPVQNALDRFQIWKSDFMTDFFGNMLKKQELKKKHFETKIAECEQRAEEGQHHLDMLAEQMSKLGMTVSQETLQAAQEEVNESRKLEAAYREKAQEEGEWAEYSKGRYETYRGNMEAASERINARLSAKQEGNQKEIDVHSTAKAELIEAQKKIKTQQKAVEAAHQSLIERHASARPGAVKNALAEGLVKLRHKGILLEETRVDLYAQEVELKEAIKELQAKNSALEEKKPKK